MAPGTIRCHDRPMEDITAWAAFVVCAGTGWSLAVWGVAEVRKQPVRAKQYQSATVASLALMVFVAVFQGAQSPHPDVTVPVVSGLVVGLVSGIFTAFGIMGGKTPGEP